MTYRYTVSIAAMFKNEAWIIGEWLTHHQQEGIDHFYLIDNGSTDNYYDIVRPFIESGVVTLIVDPYRQKLGTQGVLLNKHFKELTRQETAWLIIIDIDEYIYARKPYNTVKEWVASIPPHVHQIQFPWKCFGSNSQMHQPESVIHGFTARESSDIIQNRGASNYSGYAKSMTRSSQMRELETHRSPIVAGHLYLSNFKISNRSSWHALDFDAQPIHCNHYTHMSYEYYTKIKIPRGGGQGAVYTLKRFAKEDRLFSFVKDTELSDKKKSLHQN